MIKKFFYRLLVRVLHGPVPKFDQFPPTSCPPEMTQQAYDEMMNALNKRY